MQRVCGVVFLLGFLFLTGCSRPPEIPTLENSKTDSFPEIALRDSLTPTDFRNIFEALNQKGQLSGLKPWLLSTPDADLSILGTAINKYFYQEAFNSEGLPQFLESRIHQQGFSHLNKILNHVAKNFPELSLSQLLKSTLNHPATPKLLHRGLFAFDPYWSQNIAYFEVSTFLQSTEPSQISETVLDLKKLLDSPTIETNFVSLCEVLRNSELGKNFFTSLQYLEETHGDSVYADLSSHIKKSLQSTEKSPSIMTRLLTLVKLLNRTSGGLFSEAQKTLKTEEGETLVRLLSERFESVILKGASGFIRETLNEPFDEIELTGKFWMELPRKSADDLPTKNFTHLLRRLQFALDKISNTSRTSKDPHVTLNTFLLARWFEAMAKANLENLAALNTANFNQAFWLMPVQPFTFALNLLEIDEKGKPIKDPNGKYSLAGRIGNELKAIGMEDFASDLNWAIKQDSFGPTSTKIELTGKELKLMTALRTAINSLHRGHPIADPVPFLSSVAYIISRPGEGSPLTLADLESANMLNSLQNLLRGLSFSQVRKLVTFLFEDLDIGNISAEDREKLKTLYPNNPEVANLLDSILQNLQVIYDLDYHSRESVSLLEFYHTLISQSRLQDVNSVSKLLMFFDSSALFGTTNSKSNYPSIVEAVSSEQRLSRLLQLMGKAKPEQKESLLTLMHFIGGNLDSDVKDLFSFSREILFKNPQTIPSLLDVTKEESEFFPLSHVEKLWIYHFIQSDSFMDLYRILVANNNSENVYNLTVELERLEKNKDLEGLIKILGNMKSDRMQRLALVLWQWEKSQELDAFFAFIKTLTKS